MRVRSERSEPFCQVIGKGSRHANWPGAETCLALAWQQSCGPVERPVLGVTRWLLHWGWLPGGISSVWSLGCTNWDSTAAAVPQEYRTPVWPTAPVLVPRTEGSSDPPRCRGLGQHFDADIANGKTSLPVWPELLHDLCERARCRFCLLVCFVLLFLLAFLFFYLLFLLAFLFLLFFVCFGCFSFLVILAFSSLWPVKFWSRKSKSRSFFKPLARPHGLWQPWQRKQTRMLSAARLDSQLLTKGTVVLGPLCRERRSESNWFDACRPCRKCMRCEGFKVWRFLRCEGFKVWRFERC